VAEKLFSIIILYSVILLPYFCYCRDNNCLFTCHAARSANNCLNSRNNCT